MKISIHQPEFLPWLPLFDKIDRVEKFIFLDNVQFEKNYFHNRCKIRNGKGSFQLITIPVRQSSLETTLAQKEIDRGNRLIKKALATVRESYSKAPFFAKYFSPLEEMIYRHQFLGVLNIELTTFIAKELGICTEFCNASGLDVQNVDGSARISALVKATGGTEYLSGAFGVNYLNVDSDFPNTLVAYHEQSFPPYWQSGEKEFVPALSAIDLLFNCGPGSFNLIRSSRTPQG